MERQIRYLGWLDLVVRSWRGTLKDGYYWLEADHVVRAATEEEVGAVCPPEEDEDD
jgi:hypothetical protein